MKRQKRWMKSVIETSKTDLPAMPWAARKLAVKPSKAPIKRAA
ncbi:MAG: hypothetical protein VX083_17260 [Pseudomonadota bacterium]|jgi:hypothetical protein|nr:hypothetical protein [Thalassovita sp.]MEC8041382.1 hypothetical protein [Pseudomonadota bacterium]MEC8295241.1 hypothetical protein [Pseudomonadota bacterium]|tara:strand:+ start:523 stop:651 length:129 start_codon:yes stop_codon:yes gene_type:complete